MNSLSLFGAVRPTSYSVIKRYAFSQKDLIILLQKENKSLYGPVISTKKSKQPKKLSGPTVKHKTASTSFASSDAGASKKPETNHSSEMYWIIGNRWNDIVKQSDSKGGSVSRTFRKPTQTTELKSVNPEKPKKLVDVDIQSNVPPAVIQKPIPLSNEELKNVLTYPLQSSALSIPPSDIRAPELRALPSVGRVLQYTMSEAARNALLNWKLTKIEELGEEGFAELQKGE